jgi:site-specific recombinase XerD
MDTKKLLTSFEAYLLTEKCVAKNTFAAYQNDLKQFELFLNEIKIVLQEVQTDHLKTFIHKLHNQEVGARSIKRKISTLKTLFNYLNRLHDMPNCADQLVMPKIEKKLPRYLSQDEVHQLLTVAAAQKGPQAIRNSTILYLLYCSGMRISELTLLKISDLDFDGSCITVNGKGGKQRIIPINQLILSKIKEYINNVYPLLTHQKNMAQGTDYLFPVLYNHKVRPITRQAFWIILKKIVAKAGIVRSISPHQLRHSLATHMLKNGADLRSLQLLLGHETLATVEIYTHVETSHLRSVYDKKHPRS